MVSVIAVLIFLAFLMKSKHHALFLLIACNQTFYVLSLFEKYRVISVLICFLFVFLLVVSVDSIRFRERLKTFPFMGVFVVAWLSFFLSWILGDDLRIGGILDASAMFLLPLITWGVYDPSNRNIKAFKRIFGVYLVFLAGFGCWEAVNGINPILDYLRTSGCYATDLEQTENYVRYGYYRAQSVTIWCSSFGFVCATGCVFFLNEVMSGSYKNRLFPLCVSLLCILGVFFCGTRSVVLGFLIMLMSCVRFLKQKVVFVGVLFAVFCIQFFFAQNVEDVAYSIIDPDLDYGGGSTMDMRLLQLQTSLYIFRDNPIFGGGLGATAEAIKQHGSLYGAEGVIFTTLINRGLFGLISIFGLWGYSAWWIFRKSKSPFLCLPILGLASCKIISALLGISETFILPFVIILLKDELYKRQLEESSL